MSRRKTIGLTRRETDTLAAIQKLLRKDDIPPTFKEIGDETGVTIGAVACILKRLVSKGYITRERSKARKLRLVSQ